MAESGKLDIPSRTIITLLVIMIILAYVIFPIDLVPDVIPVWGWVDDLAVALIGMFFIRSQW